MKITRLFLILSPFIYACSSSISDTAIIKKNQNDQINQSENKINTKSLLGGKSSVVDATREAFSHFSPKLSFDEKTKFFVGESFFDQNWIIAPSSTVARDGLGPFFNARSCASCHFKDGRGRPPKNGENLESLLLRISIKGKSEHGEPLPSHIYGDQIQGFSIQNVEPEAEVKITYEDIKGKYSDGEEYILKKPIYKIFNYKYGEPESDLMISPRVANQMIGMGLLEDISENDLISFSDENDKNNDGISGKINYVWDQENKKLSVGRFGWKANQPTVRQQVAGALMGDIGITTSIFNNEYTDKQFELLKSKDLINGGSPEMIDRNLERTVIYSQNLAVPIRRNVDDKTVLEGERLFNQLSCNSCHRTNIKSGDELINPYTDLLLHDLGNDLADNRPDFLANGNEWRTPPLWGIGLFKTVNSHTNYLHDGRANNLTEAVLWHSGEAQNSKESFKKLDKEERLSLVKFLESL